MKAFLKNNRQAPRKVRLIANAVRGRNVAEVLGELGHMPQKAARSVKKLIESAVANAQQENVNIKPENLFVRTIMVDKGITYVRYMPRAFGRATPLNRECSHIRVELGLKGDVPEAPKKAPAAKKEEKAEEKKEDAPKEVAKKKEEKETAETK